MLGWDTFENVTGEHRIKGNYADFAIRDGKDLLAIIEVKAVGTTLGPKHLYQAVSYAANEGVEWVWLTNGCDWQVYRVVFSKPVDHDLAFRVSICDKEMKPKDKVELLYLLSNEARRADELNAYYEKKAALSGANAARLLLNEKMLRTLRAEMRAATGHLATLEEIATILVEEVIRPELQGDDTARLIRRAAASGRAAQRQHGRELERPRAKPLPIEGAGAGVADGFETSITAALRASEAPLGRADLIANTGIPEPLWAATIRRLLECGDVVQEGTKRGAKYRLGDDGGAASV